MFGQNGKFGQNGMFGQNGKFGQNGMFGQSGKFGHSCTKVMKSRLYGSWWSEITLFCI